MNTSLLLLQKPFTWRIWIFSFAKIHQSRSCSLARLTLSSQASDAHYHPKHIAQHCYAVWPWHGCRLPIGVLHRGHVSSPHNRQFSLLQCCGKVLPALPCNDLCTCWLCAHCPIVNCAKQGRSCHDQTGGWFSVSPSLSDFRGWCLLPP